MAENTATPPRWFIAPYFLVPDIVATADYYRDKLGFQYERFWGDPPQFTTVYRRGVTIMLKQAGEAGGASPNHRLQGDAWDAYLWVDDADALYEEFTRNGVTIARPICDQPYGCRDFDIEDCNGYRVGFGHDLEPG